MTFRWTRQRDYLTSRCQLCGHTTRERDQRAILDQQRDHDPLTCQMQRAARARALATEVYVATYKPPPRLRPPRTHCRDNHEYTPENTRMDGRGRRVCKTCEVLRVMAWREGQKTTRRLRVSPTFPAELGGRTWDNLDIKTAPITSRGLTAKTVRSPDGCP